VYREVDSTLYLWRSGGVEARAINERSCVGGGEGVSNSTVRKKQTLRAGCLAESQTRGSPAVQTGPPGRTTKWHFRICVALDSSVPFATFFVQASPPEMASIRRIQIL
jgi:hypothetical protein